MDNDLIWLQFRVLYRILGTNDLLLKISKHDDGKCSFCHNQLETITHLFVECQIVKQFWSQLKDKLKLVLQIGLNLNPTCIILGSEKGQQKNTANNLIYLVAKKYIFKTSRKKGFLSVDDFCFCLQKIYQEQEFIAKLDFKQEQFRKTWGIFNSLFLG